MPGAKLVLDQKRHPIPVDLRRIGSSSHPIPDHWQTLGGRKNLESCEGRPLQVP